MNEYGLFDIIPLTESNFAFYPNFSKMFSSFFIFSTIFLAITVIDGTIGQGKGPTDEGNLHEMDGMNATENDILSKKNWMETKN